MKQKLVVIGAGMASGLVLEHLTDAAPDAFDITLFNAEPRGNYNRIMLSPVLSGEKTYAQIVTHDDAWYAGRGVKTVLGQAVTRIDRAAKTVTGAGMTTAYDQLIIATGSAPFIIPVPGHKLPGVVTYRDLDDTNAMIAAARPGARAAFGVPAEGPVLLVSGGSQGARSINQAVEGALREIIAAGVSVLHVLGPKNITSAHEPRTDASGAVYLPLGYVDEMADAYAAADLMLARAGAGTVAETATVGLPTVFVPLPHGNGEQAKNAEGLVAAGAGVVVLDGLLTSDWLVATGLPLVLDAKRLATMGERLRGLMPADAAGRVAAMVLGAVKR